MNILMATFNGGRYLSEQLDSLLAQTYIAWELYIRDDGSTDDTADIIRHFQSRDRRIHFSQSEGPAVGASRNYALLIESAYGPYVMFCDQDDIWLPDKIYLTMKTMMEYEQRYGVNTPILVHTDCRVVDSERQVIFPSFMQYQHMKHIEDNPLRILLSQNFITGCTVMINQALLSKSRPLPNQALMHDWWLGLVAAATGKIEFLPQTTLLYRQHTNNAVGATQLISKRNFRRLFNFSELDAAMGKLMLQNLALLKHLDQLDGTNPPEILREYIDAAGKCRASTFKCVIKNRIAKQGILRNLLFYFLLARGSYVPILRGESL